MPTGQNGNGYYHNGEIYHPGSRIGVLVLHSLSGTPEKMKTLAQALSRANFTVLAPCLSGHGTKPEDLLDANHKRWVNEVVEAITRLKAICEKVYIVGDSFGGALGMTASLQSPVSGIVTLSTPVYFHRHWFWGPLLHTVGHVVHFYTKRTNGVHSYDKVPVKVLREVYEFTQTELKYAIPKVQTPMMVIQGKEDQIVSPRSAQYIFDHIATSQKTLVWVENGEHSLTTGKNQEKVFEEIITFIHSQQASVGDRGGNVKHSMN